MLSVERTAGFGDIKNSNKEYVLPSRKLAGKPVISSLTVSKQWYRYSCGFALRLAPARITAIACLLLGALVAVALGASRLVRIPYTVSASGVSLSQSSLSQASVQTEAEIMFGEYVRGYHPGVITDTALTARTALLTRYLDQRGSPLKEFSPVIAEQSHWKLILAISFAESGLGKRCVDNNCSGIGVEPGHPKWQIYQTKGEWAKALNRLLEKRYKNQTLQQMCGVYVQPCNQHWLIATNQILGELKAWGIE